jgi:hypothetical protein
MFVYKFIVRLASTWQKQQSPEEEKKAANQLPMVNFIQ